MSRSPDVTWTAHPRGWEGAMTSLWKTARMASDGRLSPRVRSWAMRRIVEAGSPEDDLGRAKAIYEAVVREKIYVGDPVDVELMVDADCTLDRCGDLSFEGGDCDDLVISTVAAIESVSIPCAVVCHGYGLADGRPKVPEHVLLAVWDRKARRWWYADPSARPALPFGSIVARPTRELWVGVPSIRVLCDSHGPCDQGRIKPDVGTGRLEGDFIGVGAPAPGGTSMLQPIKGRDLGELQAAFARTARDLGRQRAEMGFAYRHMVALREAIGKPLIDTYVHAGAPAWTLEQERKLSSLDETAVQAISYSRQGASGARRIERDAVTGRAGVIAYGYEPAIFVEPGGEVVLVNAKGRQGDTETIPAGMFGLLWPAAALGIAIALGAAVAVYSLAKSATSHVEAVRQRDLQQHEVKLRELGATPAQARKSIETLNNGAAQVAEARREQEKASPLGRVADAVTAGSMVLGALAVAGGGMWALSQLRQEPATA